MAKYVVRAAERQMGSFQRKHTKQLVVGAIVIVLIVAIAFGSFFYLNPRSYAGKTESIDIAYSPFESVALYWIAQDQQFFSQNGLNVTAHKYDTGAEALNGVMSGEADIVVGTTEFPFVVRALNQAKIRTISVISKSEFIYLVGRADRGIGEASDLKGKRVGTTFGTIAHFYLGRFLNLNGLSIQDVTLVDLKMPTEWVEAVVNGSVDAVVTAQPYANLARDGLGSNAFVLSVQSGQPLYAQAIATDEWIIEHPELCSRFLRSLLQAEEFAVNHPAEAKAIVKAQMNFSDAYMETVWSQNQFSLSFDQSLVYAMEGEARWLINNNLTNAVSVPDFLEYIYSEGLLSVKPGSVNIVY
jgi:ABC-type nitrate/sulfonate/bicarbonate transport system substrate-binding protein